MSAFTFSKDGLAYVQKEMTRYENKQSAIIRCLYKAQDENGGWLSQESMHALSAIMDIPIAQIEEVATFYTMFNLKPQGKYHIQVCCTLSCAMVGAREMTDLMMKVCGVKNLGEVSSDGRFSFSKVECLGSCDTAPMLQINRDPYIENLNGEKALKLMKELK